ncbi:MAG: transposase [Candidatus Thermoplasmatota archaeon]|jgi:predicted RNA-binding Zn-ribbon protein involved in translation (DUF1610 family)|nr:transposase [Candidatus Thermoplasmatota archaeon]
MGGRNKESEIIFHILDILRQKDEIIGEINFLKQLKSRGIGISAKRFRKVVFDIPKINVEIEFSKKRNKISKYCPVCGSKLVPVRDMTLDGRKKRIGYRCKKCNFNSNRDGKPLIYSFRLKKYDL